MAADLLQSIDDLREFDQIVKSIVTTLDRAEAWLQDAYNELRSIDDPAARQGARLAAAALDNVRNVTVGFLHDYIVKSEELAHRIAQ